MTPSPGTPVDRMLTASLVLAPALTLIASLLFAGRGWDDGAAGAVQVIAGVLDILLVVRLVTWLDTLPRTAALVLGLGALGAGGWVAYGINTIETSLGNVDLVDVSGAATIIKPLGLCWPAMLIVVGAALLRTRRAPIPCALGVLLAGVLLPISRIGNIAPLAIVVDVLVLASLTTIPLLTREAAQARTDRMRAPAAT
ncbi:MAG TPA: hypothetical protein VIU11_01420 [Nakamurella sp.]